jgi:hypothetical protein
MEQRRLRITGELINEKGRQFAQQLQISLKFSNGWLESFCKRNHFRRFRSHGESGDAQMDGIEEDLEHIKQRIACYDLNDVYNMDETGLFYNLAPDTTIARRQIEGSKKNKTRLTIAFTCNATGTDRFIPLYIGHANKPRCFQRKSGEQLGFFY